MSKINVSRWLLGGAVAGVIMWIAEGVAGALYMADMEAALTAHNLSMQMGASVFVLSLVASFTAGFVLIFLYAAARPRFGPGPKTAIMVALAMWLGGYVLSLLGYQIMGLFPTSMLALWATIGLVEMCIASLVGGWIYREAA